jgi:regulation of enolase protein 1 (concanavalin A-like superfamily)
MDLPWSAGTWTHPPVTAAQDHNDLCVTAVEGSDAWRTTSYGFVHDSEHALIAPFPLDSAMEVEFTASFSHQFDQAGIFVRVSNERWVKAGVEFADGRPQIGAVVTDGLSDWSLAPAPDRAAQRILIRVSRSGNALTIRAKPSDHDDLQLIRVVPFEPELFALAGPYTWAPTQAGLTVRFHSWRSGQPDPVECCSCTPARNRHLA